MRDKPNALHEVLGAVVGAAAEQEDATRRHMADWQAGRDTHEGEIAEDAAENSYRTTLDPGVTVEGAVTSVVGANGRRILVVDDPAGVWLGGVLIADVTHLARLVTVLSALREQRWPS